MRKAWSLWKAFWSNVAAVGHMQMMAEAEYYRSKKTCPKCGYEKPPLGACMGPG